MQNTELVTPKKSQLPAILRIVVLVAFLILAGLVAYLTYAVTRDMVATWTMTGMEGIDVKDATPTPDPLGGAVAATAQPIDAPAPTPPPWDGGSRVTMLMMGLDYRDWAAGEGPPRTDTMILFTVDPVNRTAGVLNIPRDLWVNIPGFEYGRINTAYQLGEAYKLPGGGPALAADTVEELLGVPIDYYAQVDFSAFVRFIDEIGGVTVDVPERIKIDPLGDNNTKYLKPGRQTLPGELALAYARARKTEGGDFDRAQRQQDVIMGIRERILEYEMLPVLFSKAPVLYEELKGGIKTNMDFDLALRLAWLVSQIPEENIRQGAIGAEQINFATNPDGSQQVLKPLTEKIRELRDQIFTDTGPASPATSSLQPAELLQQEAARVSVLNASYTTGLAARTAEYLQTQGITVVQTDNAQQASATTEIVFYNGKPYTVKFLVDLMKIGPYRIRYVNDPASQIDIQILVGDDWANSNIMP